MTGKTAPLRSPAVARILCRVKLAYLLALVFTAACADKPIGLPAGSNNYDDPDDPGHPGIGSGGPDASGDAYGRACVAARDCPAAFVCAYDLDAGCAAEGGVCLPYGDGGSIECDAAVACGCDGTDVMLCAPPGFAPAAVQSSAACTDQ